MAETEATLAIPEIRDYERINAEVARRLDEGTGRIVLAGAEGQRLLVAGLRGRWEGTVVVDGHAGPELAAGLDAPGLTVLCRGDAADAAGSGLIAGRLVIAGCAGDGLGYGQLGGTIVVQGDVGHRSGLMQSGGTLIVLGTVGRLAGERQSGGRLVGRQGCFGPHAGRGRSGGMLLLFAPDQPVPVDDPQALDRAIRSLVGD